MGVYAFRQDALAAFVRLGWLDQTERRYRVINRERLAQRAG